MSPSSEWIQRVHVVQAGEFGCFERGLCPGGLAQSLLHHADCLTSGSTLAC